jgi:hypothetical protein
LTGIVDELVERKLGAEVVERVGAAQRADVEVLRPE